MWKTFLGFLIISLVNYPVMAIDYNFSNKSITDDEIASSIRNPRPASITTVTSFIREDIRKKNIDDQNINSGSVKKIDLSHNNICLKGATQLLRYITNELPGIEVVDLSFNQIRDWRGREEYEDFENTLQELVAMPSLREINLNTNCLGMDWYRHILSTFPNNPEKISWR